MTQELTADMLSALYQQHRRGLLYHAWKVLRSSSAAEDAVQDAMKRAWAGREQYAGRSNPLTWLIAIVWNCAREHRRRAVRPLNTAMTIEEDFLLTDPAISPDRCIDSQRLAVRLEAALLVLKDQDRPLVRMRYWDGLEPIEIAARLGKDPAYVRLRLMRATVKVRAAMGGCRASV